MAGGVALTLGRHKRASIAGMTSVIWPSDSVFNPSLVTARRQVEDVTASSYLDPAGMGNPYFRDNEHIMLFIIDNEPYIIHGPNGVEDMSDEFVLRIAELKRAIRDGRQPNWPNPSAGWCTCCHYRDWHVPGGGECLYHAFLYNAANEREPGRVVESCDCAEFEQKEYRWV